MVVSLQAIENRIGTMLRTAGIWIPNSLADDLIALTSFHPEAVHGSDPYFSWMSLTAISMYHIIRGIWSVLSPVVGWNQVCTLYRFDCLSIIAGIVFDIHSMFWPDRLCWKESGFMKKRKHRCGENRFPYPCVSETVLLWMRWSGVAAEDCSIFSFRSNPFKGSSIEPSTG